MVSPLQKTKIFIPTTRANLVERPRLLTRLDGLQAETCRAALIIAPAGSGKTTAAVQGMNHLGWPAGWLSLDVRDNQPARCFAYLIAALTPALLAAGWQQETPPFQEIKPLLDLPGVHLEEVITLLANDLAEARGPFLLVLDDFHVITNPVLHHALDKFIDAQPPQMRLMLLSREDPVMQLARRRARAELVELRQEDLRFTLDESLAFLNQAMGLSLAQEQVELLESRTEGWIAGLQMAALALQSPAKSTGGVPPRRAYVDEFLQSFSGSHHFILDYLVEEVLSRQTTEVQTFLLESSALDRMSADLCAAVFEKTPAGAQQMLEQLARANLFVIALDEERQWYRYHHLFRDLLLARLSMEAPAQTARIERLASVWYEAHGDPRTAVEYALKAEDFSQAAALIERHINERWQTVDLEFHQLVKRLPFEVISRSPALCLQSAWLCVLFGETGKIPLLVDTAERVMTDPSRVSKPEDSGNLAFARTLKAYLNDLENRPVRLGTWLDETFAAIPISNPGMRNSVAVVIGTICFMEADFPAALRYFEEALTLDKQVNGTNAVPIATSRIVMMLLSQGKLREAERRLQEALDYVLERGSRRFYIGGFLNLLLGVIALEKGVFDEAEQQIALGLRMLEDWPMPQVLSYGYSQQSRLRTAQGDLQGARAALEQADMLRQKGVFHPIFLEAIEHARVDFLVAAQDWQGLEAWAQTNAEQYLQQMRTVPIPFRYEARLILLSRAKLELHQDTGALVVLELLAASDAKGRSGSRIHILTLLAGGSPDPERSLSAMDEALRLAAPEGYRKVILDAGEPFRKTLDRWLRAPMARVDAETTHYAEGLYRALGALPPGKDGSRTTQPPLVEPLSVREIEVLRLVAQGLTNPQIAARLVISVRTVKKHIENIHGKLDVQNRTQAVDRARKIGLLD